MLLYVATSNPGKLRDFAAFASPGVELVPLPGLASIAPPPEDEPTFTGNARAKAIFYSRHAPAGALVLADDSGLEVDALDGAPGVHSARYADQTGFRSRPSMSPDARNILCLLDALASTREADRTARYRCSLAAARDGEVVATADGTVDGEILAVPRGNTGFGYDPLFLLPDEGLTMAEIPTLDKLAFSHRGRALQALLPFLDKIEGSKIEHPVR